jgi:hypothetical protein
MLLDAWKTTPQHGRTQCGLLLRILKVYRKKIHSGYIQYTYRGFYNNRRGFISTSITIRNTEGLHQQPMSNRDLWSSEYSWIIYENPVPISKKKRFLSLQRLISEACLRLKWIRTVRTIWNTLCKMNLLLKCRDCLY